MDTESVLKLYAKAKARRGHYNPFKNKHKIIEREDMRARIKARGFTPLYDEAGLWDGNFVVDSGGSHIMLEGNLLSQFRKMVKEGDFSPIKESMIHVDEPKGNISVARSIVKIHVEVPIEDRGHRCLWCGAKLPRRFGSTMGRPRLYCSKRCARLGFNESVTKTKRIAKISENGDDSGNSSIYNELQTTSENYCTNCACSGKNLRNYGNGIRFCCVKCFVIWKMKVGNGYREMLREQKHCLSCGAVFEPGRHEQAYCTRECYLRRPTGSRAVNGSILGHSDAQSRALYEAADEESYRRAVKELLEEPL